MCKMCDKLKYLKREGLTVSNPDWNCMNCGGVSAISGTSFNVSYIGLKFDVNDSLVHAFEHTDAIKCVSCGCDIKEIHIICEKQNIALADKALDMRLNELRTEFSKNKETDDGTTNQ